MHNHAILSLYYGLIPARSMPMTNGDFDNETQRQGIGEAIKDYLHHASAENRFSDIQLGTGRLIDQLSDAYQFIKHAATLKGEDFIIPEILTSNNNIGYLHKIAFDTPHDRATLIAKLSEADVTFYWSSTKDAIKTDIDKHLVMNGEPYQF